MAGENPEDTRTGASDEFLSKSKWQRFQVLVMGPVMNLALALARDGGGALFKGADVPAFAQEPVVIGSVQPDSAAAKAGLQPGDRIIDVEGVPVDNWEEFGLETVTKANRPIKLDADPRRARRSSRRSCRSRRGQVRGGRDRRHADDASADCRRQPSQPAQEAGLRTGDVILAVERPKPEVTWIGADDMSPSERDRLISATKASR